jgi:hypothetical protein
VVTSQRAQPGDQFKLRDFPPSPFAAKLSTNTWPKPDPILQRIERDLDLNVVSTNQAEMALIAEIKELKGKLLDLQAAVNANDPLLRVYGRYVETAHDWVMKNHAREFGAGYRYFSSGAAGQGKRRNDDVVDLIDMALYRDLASNTNFTPLLKSVFEAVERKQPSRLAGSYARNDALIGFHPAAPPKPAATFEAYLAELDQRYKLVLAKLEQIQREEGIPTEAITGWMYGDLYRMLDGSAGQYVMLSTPEEVEKLRQQLQHKVVTLLRLQALAR